MRRWSRLAPLLMAVVSLSVSIADAQNLISRTTAARYGLSRPWVAQVGSPQVTGRLQYVNYVDGLLLVQSSRGMITALDAETGRTLWATQVGSRNSSNSEPAANTKRIVVLNGSTMYVVDRANGEILWQRRVTGAPGAGPGVTNTHAFVPMTSGKIEGYDLEKGIQQTPWNYQSTGRLLTPPITTAKTVSWTTEKGYFYVADAAATGIRYRLETRGKIHSRPASWGSMLFAASTDGFVYGIDEEKGTLRWKNSLGEPVYSEPVAVNNKLFIVPEFGGMYCIDTADGTVLWHTQGISQFVAMSPTRVYAADRVGGVAILDAASGARLGTMPASATTLKIANGTSDRIFVVDQGCVVQCLHEAQLNTPVIYVPPTPPVEEPPKVKTKPVEESAADEEMPAEEMPAEEPAGDEANPFDEPAEAPAEEAPAAEAPAAGGDAGAEPNPFENP